MGGRLFASAGQGHLRSRQHPLSVLKALCAPLGLQYLQPFAGIAHVDADSASYLFGTTRTPIIEQLHDIVGTRSRQRPADCTTAPGCPGLCIGRSHEPKALLVLTTGESATYARFAHGCTAAPNELAGFRRCQQVLAE